MPIYEYQCTECGKTFEIFQKISEDPLTECKVCNGRLTKLISNCAFHLKGTGWYVTDYKKPVDSASGGKNGKHAEKTESSSPEPAAQASAETTSSETTKSDSASAPASATGGTA